MRRLTEEQELAIVELATTKDSLGRIRTYEEIAKISKRSLGTVARVLRDRKLDRGRSVGVVASAIPAFELYKENNKNEITAPEVVVQDEATIIMTEMIKVFQTENGIQFEMRAKAKTIDVIFQNGGAFEITFDQVDELISNLMSCKKAIRDMKSNEVY